MKKTKTKLISLLLTLVMVVGMIPLTVIPTVAAGITYIDADGKEQTANSYTTLPSSGSISGVYYLTDSKSITSSISLSGNTTFIVANGANYTFTSGITGSYDLNIFNEKGSTNGQITVSGTAGAQNTAGSVAISAKTLSISNVTVTCKGGNGGVGSSGGGPGRDGGYAVQLGSGLNLYGGTLNATGGSGGKGGTGLKGSINAKGGNGGTGGIGAAAIYLSSSSAVNINIKANATLNATGGNGGNGGTGGEGGSAQGWTATAKLGGNGGDGGISQNAISAYTNSSSINITSGKATIQSGTGGSYGSGGLGGTTISGDRVSSGSNGSSGFRNYAIGSLTNNFNSLPTHRGGSSSSATGWNSSSVSTYNYIYAEKPAYTVTLNNNGGTGGTTSVLAEADSAMPTATMPTKAGHIFDGYFDAQTGGTKYYNADGTSARNWDKYADATLYAQWTEHTATLTYDDNGHGTAPEIVTMKYSAATSAAAAITAEGYTFTGWNTEADGNGTSYAAGAEVKAANAIPTATTLYAQWTENTATLTYDANGHGTAPETVTMKTSEATNAADAITAEGYTFTGWNTNADGTGTSYVAGAEVKAANVDPTATTLYAQWTANTTRCDITAGWQEWTSTDSLPTSGYYYLANDVTIPGDVTIAAGNTLYLDLNGKIIDLNFHRIYDSGVFNLYDSNTATVHKGYLAQDGDNRNDIKWFSGNGTGTETETEKTLYGGVITNGDNANAGGGVYAAGTFNMYGGTLCSCRVGSQGTGAGVYVSGTFNMYNGSLCYNLATTNGNGGGVYVSASGTFNMFDGLIYGNKAFYSGGAIANVGGTVNISGGKIYSNNTLYSRSENVGGAGISTSDNGTTTLSGSVEFYSNHSGYGGALKIYNGTVNIDGAEIGLNTASRSTADGTYSGVRNTTGVASTVTYTSGRFHTSNEYLPAISGTSAITFDKNGGSGGTSSITATWNADLPTIEIPTLTGYTFLGYFNADGEQYYGADGKAFNKPGDENKTLENGYAYYGNGTKWDYIGAQTLYAKWQSVTDEHLESGECDVGGLMGHQDRSDNHEIGRVIIPLTQDQLEKIGKTLVIVGGDNDSQTTLSIDCAYTYFYNRNSKGENEMITAKNMGYAAFVIIEKDEYGNDISGYGYYRLYNESADDKNNFLFDVMYKKPNN